MKMASIRESNMLVPIAIRANEKKDRYIEGTSTRVNNGRKIQGATEDKRCRPNRSGNSAKYPIYTDMPAAKFCRTGQILPYKAVILPYISFLPKSY